MSVFPVYGITFKIGKAGRSSAGADMVAIADMETFEPSIDGKVQEWTPMDTFGWLRRFLTGKSLSLKINGKRNSGDPGNDYVSSRAFCTGADCNSKFSVVFPNGETLDFDCVVNISKNFGGQAADLSALEFEILSDGKPTYSGTGIGALTFVCAKGVAALTTKIASVVPALTGGNSYLYKINGPVPALNQDLTGAGWGAYVLGADIPTLGGNTITLVEVTAALLAVKAGQATTVIV
jgi:hypothetical protein